MCAFVSQYNFYIKLQLRFSNMIHNAKNVVDIKEKLSHIVNTSATNNRQ